MLAALATFTRPDYKATWHQFIGYLMLDAWIGNTDRHHENWGLIIGRDRVIRLAPTFDHASSLGRELTDNVRAERLETKDTRYSVEAFSNKARSALYADQSDRKPLTPISAFAMAARAQRESGFFWIDKLAQVNDAQIEVILSRMPEEFMSKICKDFAKALLDTNKKKLLQMGRSAQ